MRSWSLEQSASLWSRIYFKWVRPTLDIGVRQPLSVQDLMPLNEAEDPERNDLDLQAKLAEHNARRARRPMLKSLWELNRSTIGKVFLISMVQVTASVASPLILRQLIRTLGFGSNSGTNDALLAAGLLFVSALLFSMSAHHNFHILLKLMNRVRSGLIMAIYRKALKLTNESRDEASSGQIINLMGTDAQKFVNSLNLLHSLWMHPLQFAFVMAALYWVIGPAALAGAAVLMTCLMLSSRIAKRQVEARKRLVRHSDDRVSLMNEILMSIRVIKFYAWEASFAREVLAIRGREVIELTKLIRLGSFGALLFLSTPVLVAVATFGSLVLSGAPLDPANVFASLALFTVLRHAMVTLPDVVTTCLEANVAAARIEAFLAKPELPGRLPSARPAGSVVLEAATAIWASGSPALHGVDMTIAPGEFLCVVGAVGSGKSALLSALLGDLLIDRGRIDVSGRVAYVSQQPWILNDTIRNNVLFGLPLDEDRYRQVLRDCALEEDLAEFPAGDNTEIGERGVNLSGGQRQRISLARAVYADADVYVLDDPLSALDHGVSHFVFERCFRGVLAGKTRILSTHRLEFVHGADRVAVMAGGKVIELGPPDRLKVESRLSALQGDSNARVDKVVTDEVAPGEGDAGGGRSRRLMTEEERNTGVVGWKVYKLYLGVFAPGIFLLGIAIAFLAKEILGAGTDSWLAYWSSSSKFESRSFLVGFVLLGFAACAATYARTLIIALRGLGAGTSFHARLLDRVLKAPMAFFESTPVGRVLNRFSRDMEAIDHQIPRSLGEALGCIFTIATTVLMIVVVTPLSLFAVVPISFLYYRIQRLFRPASREGQRLDSITRSPIFAQFSESLAGVPVIRAFNAEARFERELLQHIETNARAFYTIVSANRWLGTRIETLGAALVAAAAFSAAFAGSRVSPGFAGLSVAYSLAITGAMNWAVRMFSQLESNLNSVERVNHYSNLASEQWDGVKVSASWPDRGEIRLEGVELRYRPELPAVIESLNATITPGEKIGIVGRTGAGKSSLLLGLFRVIEASRGKILIDGVDIATVPLRDLRSALSVIPQEPVLFRGTVRKNIDPFASASDTELWNALDRAALGEVVRALPGGLDAPVSEGGRNFSVGQRQLLCLARALLKRSRILLLDEATASVDVETDAHIQATIRLEFKDATVLTIAHRLPTVMDADRIMVLDHGRMIDFDAPKRAIPAFQKLGGSHGVDRSKPNKSAGAGGTPVPVPLTAL